MAASDPITGIGGSIALGASDAWTAIADVEVFEWTMNINPERIESTTFADAGIWRKWYHGDSEVTVDFNGHWPLGVAYPLADVTEGIAGSTLTLTSQTDTIGGASGTKTITIVGMVKNIKQGVNRHTGLNTMTAQFIGRISATA